MDTVTYPEPQVQSFLEQYLVPVRLNTVDASPKTMQELRPVRMVWTPTMVWEDHHGIEIRREVGFFAPDAFLAASSLAQGQAHLLHGQFSQSEQVFLDVVERSPVNSYRAEALFWAGVAALRVGSRERFIGHWTRLYEMFPTSPWTSRSSFIRES